VKYFLTLIFLLLIYISCHSQSSKDSTLTGIITDSLFVFAPSAWWNERYIKIDTAIERVQENIDFIRAELPYSASIANVGSSVFKFNFSSDSSFMIIPAVNEAERGFEIMQLRGLFNEKRPYTHVMFISGPQNEQDIMAEYGIQIKKLFRLGAKYVYGGSDGIYSNSSNKFSNLDIYTAFTTQKKNYNSIMKVQLGRISIEENGGIKEDTSGSYPVNLYYAKNNLTNKAISLHNHLNFEFDSLIMLDNEMKEEKKDMPRIEIGHSVSYLTKGYLYTDDLIGDEPLYYNNIFYDSSSTEDSIHISDLTNTVNGFYRKINSNKSGGWKLGIEGVHQFINLYQNEVTGTTFTNLTSAFIAESFSLKNKAGFKAGYSIYGYYKNNFSFNLNYQHLWGDTARKSKTCFNSSFDYQKITPSFFYQNYHSNHFKWQNDFTDIGILKFNAGFDFDRYKFKAALNAYHFENYIYYDNNSEPNQYTASLNVITGEISKKFSLYKFHLSSNVLIQKASNEAIVHIPLFYLKQALYFESFMFKKAMQLQIGLTLNYFTEYYGNSYMTALGRFYLQDSVKVGNYPFIDAYAAAKIKKVRLFIKLQHITSGLIDGSEYMIPSYLVPPRILKWGVSWMFVD
jgi:hypothetical protein